MGIQFDIGLFRQLKSSFSAGLRLCELESVATIAPNMHVGSPARSFLTSSQIVFSWASILTCLCAILAMPHLNLLNSRAVISSGVWHRSFTIASIICWAEFAFKDFGYRTRARREAISASNSLYEQPILFLKRIRERSLSSSNDG